MSMTKSSILASALLALSTGHVLASTQKTVHVGVSVEAPHYRVLSDQAKADVESRLADTFIGFAARRYPFLEWVTAPADVPRLDVHLVEDSRVTPLAACHPKLDLRFEATTSSGADSKLEDAARGVVVFEACDPRAFPVDTATLLDRAALVLDSAFAAVDFRRDFEKGFVSLVAFADTIEPRDTTIFLPGCDSLLLGGGSKLSVQFAESSPSGDAQSRGFLHLHNPSPTWSQFTAPDGSKQTVEGYFLASASHGPLQQLAAAEEEGRLAEIHVFVTEYERSIQCTLLRPGGNQPVP